MRFMVIENNVATNAIEADSPSAVPGLTLVQSNTANIGDLWNGATWTPAPPKPVDPEKDKEENKATAIKLLQETDWVEVPSVRDTNVTPHLTNGFEFDAYRLALRQIALNPPITIEEWPTKPAEEWVF